MTQTQTDLATVTTAVENIYAHSGPAVTFEAAATAALQEATPDVPSAITALQSAETHVAYIAFQAATAQQGATALAADLAPVTPPPPATLVLGTVSSQSETVGTAIPGITLSASGGTGAITYSVSGLPAGLSLSGAKISGTPTIAGVSTVTVTATDSGSPAQQASEKFSVTVATAVTPPPPTGHPVAAWYPGGAGNPSGQKSLWSTYSPNLSFIYCDGAVYDTWPDVDNLMTWLGGMENPAIMLPIPLCLTGQSLAQAWSANAGVFTTIGQKLIAAGVNASESIMRIAWEYSGNWYPDSAAADGTDFVKCGQRAASEMKALGFKVFQCCAINSAPGNFTQAQLYWGDQYVDIYGGDLYDECYNPAGGNNPANAAACWKAILAGPWGLSATIAFAESRGKPFGYGELGLANTTDNVGLGDDTSFLPNALGAAKACTSGFACVEYFSATQGQAGRIGSDIGEFPKSAAAAKSVFATL